METSDSSVRKRTRRFPTLYSSAYAAHDNSASLQNRQPAKEPGPACPTNNCSTHTSASDSASPRLFLVGSSTDTHSCPADCHLGSRCRRRSASHHRRNWHSPDNEPSISLRRSCH